MLLNGAKPIRYKVDGTNYTGSAATTDLTSEAIDTSGYEGVAIVVGFGAIVSGAVTSIKVQECDTSGGTYADLTGTAITVADTDDNKIAVSSIFKPLKRYVKVVVDRGTQNATVDFGLALLYGAHEVPVDTDSMTIAVEKHVSPVAGTA